MADTVDLTDEHTEPPRVDTAAAPRFKRPSANPSLPDEIDLTEDSPRDQRKMDLTQKGPSNAHGSLLREDDAFHRKRIMDFAASVTASKRQRMEAESIAPALAAVTITSSSPVNRACRSVVATDPNQASHPESPPAPDAAPSSEVPSANLLLHQLHKERLARQRVKAEAAAAGTSEELPKLASKSAPHTGAASSSGVGASMQADTDKANGMTSSKTNTSPLPSAHGLSHRVQATAAASNPMPSGCGTQPADFDLLTYNVWFAPDAKEVRMKGIADIVQSLNYPCFICFQEVTPGILQLLSKMPFWRHYDASPVDPANYFTMLLCHKDKVGGSVQFFSHEFTNSVMGRGLLGCHCKVGGTDVCISTVHLESPCNGQTFSESRKAQLKLSLDLLEQKPEQNVLVAGDTNWSTKDGELPLAEGWHDAWLDIRPGEPGYTYNSRENAMLMGNWAPQRFDRVLFKMSNWEARSIDIVGNQQLPNKFYNKHLRNGTTRRMPVLPSDHYGVLARFGQKAPL